MKINTLELHNIQKHESLLLSFSGGVNAIVGDTDCGKSSIIRALTFVLFNKPNSQALRRHYTDENGKEVMTRESWVKINITGDDGNDHIIKRFVSDSDNTYELDGHVFKSFGRSVPAPIVALYNLDISTNMQRQFDSPFLLSQSSGEVSKVINDIAGLSEIDKLSAAIGKDIRSTIAERDALTKQIADLDTKLKRLPSSEQLTSYANDIQTHKTEIGTLERSIEKITSVCSSINSSSIAMSVFSKLESISTLLNKVHNSLVIVSDLVEREHSINTCITNIKETSFNVDVPDITDVGVLINALNTDVEKYKNTKSLVKNIYTISDDIRKQDVSISTANEMLSTIEICPTCKRPL